MDVNGRQENGSDRISCGSEYICMHTDLMPPVMNNLTVPTNSQYLHLLCNGQFIYSTPEVIIFSRLSESLFFIQDKYFATVDATLLTVEFRSTQPQTKRF